LLVCTLGTPFTSVLWGRPSHFHILFSTGSERAMVIVDVSGRCYPSLPRMSIMTAPLFGFSDSMFTRGSFDHARMPNVKMGELWGRPSHLHILLFSRSERATMIVDVLGRCYPSLPRMSTTAAPLFGFSDSMSARRSLCAEKECIVFNMLLFPPLLCRQCGVFWILWSYNLVLESIVLPRRG